MVKADQHSESAQRLQAAGKTVKREADTLVSAAQSVFDAQLDQEVRTKMECWAIILL